MLQIGCVNGSVADKTIVVLAFAFGTNRIKKREKLNDMSFDVHVFFQQQQVSENIQS